MRRLMALGAGTAAALGMRAVAFAQEGEAAAGATGGGTGYGLWDWLQIGFRLALVLAVIWGAFIALRWYMRRVNGDAGTPGARQLQIVETRTLGPNRALHLVRVGERAVLIGVTQERINQLMSFDDPEEVDRLSQLPPESETRSFRSIMGSLHGSLPTSLRSNGAAETRRGDARDAAGAPEPSRSQSARARGRGSRITRVLGGALRRFAGLPPAGTPRASRAPAPRHDEPYAAQPAEPVRQAPARAPQPRVDGLFDATPANALALRARNGYGTQQTADDFMAPASSPAPRRTVPGTPGGRAARAPRMNSGSRAALDAAADAAARSAAGENSRDTQINELQRAIASARRGLGLDAESGRIGR